jgi:predicted RNA-binding protein with TRAM domain
LTKYRNYREVYDVDVKRFSIYRGANNLKDDVVIGDEIDVLVKEIDESGRGVGFYRGYKVLIPKGFINERVRVRIVKISDEGLLGVVVRRYGGTK